MFDKKNWKKAILEEVCDVNYGTRVVNNQVSGTEFFVYGGGGATFQIDRYNREDCLVIARFAMSKQCVRFIKGKFFLNDSGLSLMIKDPNEISPDFLNYQIFGLNDTIYNLSKGVAQKNLDVPSFRKLNIVIPPTVIQHQIVSELDALNIIITKKKQQLADLDKLAQATFYDMFGDPVSNEKGWNMKRLEDLGQWASGGTPSRSIGSYFTGNINWYSAGELNSLFLPPSEEKITEIAIKESSAKLFKSNSLFVGMYDTAAFKMGITKTEASSNQACANIFPNSSVSIVFLYFMLKEMKEHFLKMRRGIRQQNLNLGMIKKFHIPLPPISLQTLFVEKIESIEKQKELINKSIADVQQLFDYTMDKYFN